MNEWRGNDASSVPESRDQVIQVQFDGMYIIMVTTVLVITGYLDILHEHFKLTGHESQ